jgi:hypothetical protein
MGGGNISPPNSNDLIGYFSNWDKDKTFPSGDTGAILATTGVFRLYINIYLKMILEHIAINLAVPLIIKNIPLTSIEDIQALVLYNRQILAENR